MFKKIYGFHHITKDYLGQVDAQESPREPGVFLIPANSTEIPAPAFDASVETCRFEDGEWVVSEIKKPEEQAVSPNDQILAQLAANDAKIVRAIAEGDAARIAAHNAAQAALRAQLV